LHAAWEGKGPVPVSGEEGIRVMRILDAAAESSRQGKVINL
jgi:predicted dehydrogenase